MTIVILATPDSEAESATDSFQARVVIEVSQPVGERLRLKLSGHREGRLNPSHLPRLRAMAAARERDSDLGLVIRAIEAHGEVYVRLI